MRNLSQNLGAKFMVWWTPQWVDMRGNAKFFAVLQVLNVIAIVLGKLTLAPHWQVWAFLAMAAYCAFVWITLRKFH
jgi:hypothetical protein